jgi:hypothetical protein
MTTTTDTKTNPWLVADAQFRAQPATMTPAQLTEEARLARAAKASNSRARRAAAKR